jgi:hypothetical protein
MINGEDFDSQRYIYSDGYDCERLYGRVINPKEQVWYNCRIFDDAGYFRVFRAEIKNE